MRLISLTLCLLLSHSAVLAEESTRRFEFSYEIVADELPEQSEINLYVPLPIENSDQRIIDTRIETDAKGSEKSETGHGNRYYQINRAADDQSLLTATFTWTVERNVVTANNEPLTETERERYLASNTLVPVGHEILAPIQEEIYVMRDNDSPAATARAIYDWVVDNVEYKKVGSGWGNGDTFWACNERYGNCTDFHALFIALARSEGIPARFEIGFPVPNDRDAGEIGGYHCWVQFYLPEQGWVPIDASEAAKHPEKRELFYGTHPADRIHFTTGRDLVVSEASVDKPLNYFIFPHLEIDGEISKTKLDTKFSYRELTASTE